MCDCIEKIKEGINRRYLENGTKISDIVFDDGKLVVDKETMEMKSIMTAQFSFSIDGKKKREKINIMFGFCPFCGEKQSE